MNRVAEIKERIRAGQPIEQSFFRHPDAVNRIQVLRITGRLLVKQTIATGESMLAESPLKTVDPCLVIARIVSRGQHLQPDRIQFQAS